MHVSYEGIHTVINKNERMKMKPEADCGSRLRLNCAVFSPVCITMLSQIFYNATNPKFIKRPLCFRLGE